MYCRACGAVPCLCPCPFGQRAKGKRQNLSTWKKKATETYTIIRQKYNTKNQKIRNTVTFLSLFFCISIKYIDYFEKVNRLLVLMHPPHLLRITYHVPLLNLCVTSGEVVPCGALWAKPLHVRARITFGEAKGNTFAHPCTWYVSRARTCKGVA